MKTSSVPSTVDAYILASPKETQSILQEIRLVIRKSAPNAKEKMSYGMPFYEYGGSGYRGRLIYFAVFKNHVGIFIPPSTGKIPKEMKAYQTAKSSFRFPLGKPIPYGLIGKTVKALVAQKDAVNTGKQ